MFAKLPEAFKKFGEWSSIGSIFFDKINQPNTDPQFSTDNYAQALFPNQSVVPLENEIVYIMAFSGSGYTLIYINFFYGRKWF